MNIKITICTVHYYIESENQIMIEDDIFESKHVKDVYNKISMHFDKTRYHTWPKIQQFTDSFKPNSKVADVGCGNGRNCNLRSDCIYHGYDNCEGFVKMCKEKNISCKLSSILCIDCASNTYDYTMCIAVIHHLKTEERRIQAISELLRITKPNGKIMIYVWAKEQKKFRSNYENDIMVPWNLQNKYNVVDSVCEQQTFYRFYHVFNKFELENMIKSCPFYDKIEILESGYQKDNYYVILRKKV